MQDKLCLCLFLDVYMILPVPYPMIKIRETGPPVAHLNLWPLFTTIGFSLDVHGRTDRRRSDDNPLQSY